MRRYGLPVNFQAMLLQPNKKNTKRLRDVLHQLYSQLDGSGTQGGGAHDVSASHVGKENLFDLQQSGNTDYAIDLEKSLVKVYLTV